jgi:hypothetical protein
MALLSRAELLQESDMSSSPRPQEPDQSAQQVPQAPAAESTHTPPSRRQFVNGAMRKAAYVAPIVVSLAASQSALGASASGGPS